MRSGTTWAQVLLNSHPHISCKGEGHFPNQFAPLLKGILEEHNGYVSSKNSTIFKGLAGYPRFTEDHYLYLLTSAITLMLGEQAKNRSVRAIGEKTPDNISFLPLLDTAFPRAKFIHIVRDGRDCAISGWFHNLRADPEWTKKSFVSLDHYVETFAEYWVSAVRAGSKFGAHHPARYLEIRYEDLSSDTGGALEKVLRFLGVGFGEGIVTKCCAEASFERLSGGRPRGQENRDSFFRKGTSADWRNHLSDEMNKNFQKKAGEWLARFGYS